MSYCRFSEASDVYCYESAKGWECCGCSLNEHASTFDSPAGLARHLIMDHRRAGHLVPQEAIDALILEGVDLPRLTWLLGPLLRHWYSESRARIGRFLCPRIGHRMRLWQTLENGTLFMRCTRCGYPEFIAPTPTHQPPCEPEAALTAALTRDIAYDHGWQGCVDATTSIPYYKPKIEDGNQHLTLLLADFGTAVVLTASGQEVTTVFTTHQLKALLTGLGCPAPVTATPQGEGA